MPHPIPWQLGTHICAGARRRRYQGISSTQTFCCYGDSKCYMLFLCGYRCIYAHINICLCGHVCSGFRPKFNKAIERILKLQELKTVELSWRWWKLSACLNLLCDGNLIMLINLGAQGQSESQEQSDHLGQTNANCCLSSQLPTHRWCCRHIAPNPALLDLSSFAAPFFKESHKSMGFPRPPLNSTPRMV